MIARILNWQSLTARISALVLVSVLAAVAGLIVYADHAAYDLTRELRGETLEQLAASSRNALADFIGNNMKLVKVVAAQKAIRDVLRNGQDENDVAQSRMAAYIGQYPNLWGIFTFDMAGKVLAGTTAKGTDLRGENRGRLDAVQAVLSGKDSFISPTLGKSESGDGLVYRMAAAVKNEAGAVVGGVMTAIDLNSFSKEILDDIKIGKSGYAFMLDADGRFIAHAKNKDLLLKNIKDVVPTLAEASKKQDGVSEYVFNGEAKMAAFRKCDATGWVVGVTFPIAEATAAASSMRWAVTMIGAGVCVLLVGVLVIVIRRMIAAPLLSIQKFAGEIASGDYATELSGRFTCELATLADSVRTMKDNIKQEIDFAKTVLNNIPMPCVVFDKDNKTTFINQDMLIAMDKPGSPQDYLGHSSGWVIYGDENKETQSARALKSGEKVHIEYPYVTKAGAHKIFDVKSLPLLSQNGKIMGAMGIWFELTELRGQQKTIEAQRDRIAEVARMADAISDKLATAAEELSAQIEESSRGAEHQKDRLRETVTAVEQMNATIMDVAKNSGAASHDSEAAREKATAGRQVVQESILAIRSMHEKARRMKDGLSDLGNKAESIGAIMQIIEDIADQTNLLALNAAIEAARAGDAGRGFAVVADEVRKLAEKTMGATKEVGSAISAIQAGTRDSISEMDQAATHVEKSVTLTERAGDALQEIVQVTMGASDMVRNIAAAAEEQSAASEQIAKSAEEVSAIASETADAMSQSALAVSELARMAAELKALIARMRE